MSCDKCKELCVMYSVQSPSNLRSAIKVAHQNVEDGTLSEIKHSNSSNQISLSALAAGALWDDIIEFRFRCNSCSEIFSLHAETYHGSGGAWVPENHATIRKNL